MCMLMRVLTRLSPRKHFKVNDHKSHAYILLIICQTVIKGLSKSNIFTCSHLPRFYEIGYIDRKYTDLVNPAGLVLISFNTH